MWADYIDKYEISSNGELRNTVTSRILKPKLSYKGYVYYGISIAGKYKDVSAHKAVAETFVDNPETKPQVNHINGNKQDNHYLNLEWVTQSENMQHGIKTGLITKEYCKKAIAQYNMEGDLIRTFESISDAAEHVKGLTGNITNCCKGKRKSHRGFKWAYVE